MGPHSTMLRSPVVRNTLLLLLAFTAGGADAISFIELDVFTANMTGNTILLGIALARANWVQVTRSGLALAGYVVGVAVGAWVADSGKKDDPWPAAVTVALALEGLLLAGLALGWLLVGPSPMLIVLAALAMGVQSAAVRRLNVSGVSTTYMTGTLTMLFGGLVDGLTGAAPATHGPKLQAAVWGCCLGGVIVAAIILTHTKLIAVAIPAAILAVVVAVAAMYFRKSA